MTRHNIGAGIGDKITLKSVEAVNAEQITLFPTEKLSNDEEQLHNVMISKIMFLLFMIQFNFQHKWVEKYNLLQLVQNHQNQLL